MKINIDNNLWRILTNNIVLARTVSKHPAPGNAHGFEGNR